MKAAIALFEGVEELDAMGPLEVLGVARQLGAELDVELIQLGDNSVLTGAHGTRFLATLPSRDSYDAVIVPGGGWLRGAGGIRQAITKGDLVPWLRRQSKAGALIAGVCTGSFALAEAGLLRGRAATTHHSAFAELERYGVIPSTARVIDAGMVVTCGGVTAGIDLTLHLISRFFDQALRQSVEEYLEYEMRGPLVVV